MIRRLTLIALPVLGSLYILNIQSYLGLVPWKEQYLGVFIALVFTSVYLSVPPTKHAAPDRVPWYDYILAASGFTVGIYITVLYPEIVMTGRQVTPDKVVFGAFAILLGLEAARRTLGWTFVCLTCIFIFYVAYPNLFPGFLWGKPTSWPELIVYLYLDTGSFLYLVGIAAVLVLSFILFGQVLFSFGGGKVLTELALGLMGRYRGGPAKAAVVASSLFGTISGSALSNIMVTGSVTIPLMKRLGYKPHMAAAIETVSSNGGTFMPPVMGIVAFIMADITGLPYHDIAIAACIPAILYYAAILIQVDLEAAKMQMTGLPPGQRPPLMPILKRSWVFLLPLVFIIYTLFIMKLPPATAALYATIFGFIVLIIPKDNRSNLWQRSLDVLEQVGRTLLNVGVLLICAGFIIAAVTLSGLGFKLSLALVQLGGSNILFILFLAAVSGIIMGMGLPASGTYVLLAVLIVPALTQLGMSPLASHFFILYYGNLALITPPIALGAFVAAGLANSSPMATGWCAMRLSILAYIIPFLFMFSPALFMRASAWDVIVEATTAIIATLSLGVALTGHFYRTIPWTRRILFGLGTSILFISVAVNPVPTGLLLKLVGLAVVVPLFWGEWKQRRSTAENLTTNIEWKEGS